MSPRRMNKLFKKPKRKFRNGVFCGCHQCQIGGLTSKYKNKGMIVSHFFL